MAEGKLVGTVTGAAAGFRWPSRLGAQLLVPFEAMVIAGVWSLAASFVIIVSVRRLTGWRIGREGELQGLDCSSHSEAGYHTTG